MKLWILATSISLALAGWGLAQHRSEEKLSITNGGHFYYLPQLSQEDIQYCLEHLSSSILVCPEGTSIPLNFFLKGDLIELESSLVSSNYYLKIKQTFYLSCQDDQIMVSLDGLNWKSWLEMLTGNISLTIGVNETGPELKLDGTACLRSHQEGN